TYDFEIGDDLEWGLPRDCACPSTGGFELSGGFIDENGVEQQSTLSVGYVSNDGTPCAYVGASMLPNFDGSSELADGLEDHFQWQCGDVEPDPINLTPVGTAQWRLGVGHSIREGTGAIGEDCTIYTTNDEGKLFAVSPQGEIKWEFHGGDAGTRLMPLVAPDGTILAPMGEHTLVALNPDGTQKWEYETESPQYMLVQPAVAPDGTIYIAAEGALIALSSAGAKKWEYAFDGDEDRLSAPAIGADGTIYVNARKWSEGRLHAISSAGVLQWTYNTGSCTSAAIADDGTIYVGTGDGLQAITPDGKNKWFTETDDIPRPPVIGSDGTIYAKTGGYKLQAFNSNGQKKWSFETGFEDDDLVDSSPTIGADGIIYINTVSGDLYAIKSNGQVDWQYNDDTWEAMTSPLISPTGAVYVGWYQQLYSISSTSFGLADSPWPKDRGNAQNMGHVVE
ncbi:MAG: PQQ-like beta-propeller repeat protein, partial [Proteobacteria bacterium]|nr:PQQ-like beta-propeller repeat protein [Pseudomonadota bacterium]